MDAMSGIFTLWSGDVIRRGEKWPPPKRMVNPMSGVESELVDVVDCIAIYQPVAAYHQVETEAADGQNEGQ
jgi:hypothetical protein